jgi:hypothetical protein
LPGGATNYVQISNTLQASSTFYVSSATISRLQVGSPSALSDGKFNLDNSGNGIVGSIGQTVSTPTSELLFRWYTFPSTSSVVGYSGIRPFGSGIPTVRGQGFVFNDANNNPVAQVDTSIMGLSVFSTGYYRMYDADNSNYVGIKASSTLVANSTWTWAGADGTVGQALITDGFGNLSFATVSGSGSPGGSNTQVQFNNSGSFGGVSSFTYLNPGTIRLSSGTRYSQVGYSDGSNAFVSSNDQYFNVKLATGSAASLTPQNFIEAGGIYGLNVRAPGGTPGAIKVWDGTNSNYVSFKASATLSSSEELILPNTHGASGQVMQTDGNNNLSWANAGSSPLSGFYLKDSSNVKWLVVPNTSGNLTSSVVSSVPSGSFYRTSFVMQDSSFAFWTVTINTSGNLVTTAGGSSSATVQDMLANDSAGITWIITVSTAGALVTQ